jgi:hypothetical protein
LKSAFHVFRGKSVCAIVVALRNGSMAS